MSNSIRGASLMTNTADVEMLPNVFKQRAVPSPVISSFQRKVQRALDAFVIGSEGKVSVEPQQGASGLCWNIMIWRGHIPVAALKLALTIGENHAEALLFVDDDEDAPETWLLSKGTIASWFDLFVKYDSIMSEAKQGRPSVKKVGAVERGILFRRNFEAASDLGELIDILQTFAEDVGVMRSSSQYTPKLKEAYRRDPTPQGA